MGLGLGLVVVVVGREGEGGEKTDSPCFFLLVGEGGWERSFFSSLLRVRVGEGRSEVGIRERKKNGWGCCCF